MPGYALQCICLTPGRARAKNAPMPNEKPIVLISACLCGVPCRYDGAASTVDELARLCDEGLALPVCPELEGGLAAPRSPCEIKDGRVLARDGADQTAAFAAGAQAALKKAQECGIRAAVLKERSPSCGTNIIYDGTFSGRRISGQGVTAALLARHGIKLFNEDNFGEALAEILKSS